MSRCMVLVTRAVFKTRGESQNGTKAELAARLGVDVLSDLRKLGVHGFLP